MRILTISALFHPYVLGGAENSAANLAKWLAKHGDEVNVLSAASTLADEVSGEAWQGLKIWRRHFPRPYPVSSYLQARPWQKPIWHLMDMFDPRNRSIVGKVLDDVKPDVALVHVVPGIGFNALRELAQRNIPAAYYLHDLGLACVKMSMFKKGRNCERQCLLCKTTSSYKQSILADFSRIGFCSPSSANLEHVQKYVPLQPRLALSIPNANHYPSPTRVRELSPRVRFLYAGRLHPQKGIEMALEVLCELAPRFDFSVRVVGGGPSESALRTRYTGEAWCTFTGHVPQADVANEMGNADVLLVPSVWLENSPGVVIHALALGLPVIGSDKGGIPELVHHDVNGLLVRAGDRTAWAMTLESVLVNPEQLQRWRLRADNDSAAFDQDTLGRRHRDFIQAVVGIEN